MKESWWNICCQFCRVNSHTLEHSSLSAHHMPAPFIPNSRRGTPSPQCQALSAKFQQLVAAFKKPRRSVLLLIGGLWSSLPTTAAILPTPLSIAKTLFFCATSSELFVKYTHTSACSSCWLS